MKTSSMNANLDQWIRSTNTSKNPVDHLAAFKKLTISDGKFQWPTALTSTNPSYWLASSNKNEINQPATTWIKTHYEILRQDDNKKWLVKSKEDKVDTDLVTLTGSYSQWLSTPSTTTVESLPGKRTSTPSKDDSESIKSSLVLPIHPSSSELDNWLYKPISTKKTADNLPKDLDDWLIIPKKCQMENKNIFHEWSQKSLHLSWTQSASVKVEEWLKEALEDDTNETDDDFDECSIEIIEH